MGALPFKVTRFGRRYAIDATDRFLEEIATESIECEGDVELSAQLADRIETQALPCPGILGEGYEAEGIDHLVTATLETLRADPHSSRNGLVLHIEQFRDVAHPDTWGDVALLDVQRVYSVESVESMLEDLLAIAAKGDTHAVHEEIRCYRRGLKLSRVFDRAADCEAGVGRAIVEHETSAIAGYPDYLIDGFLSTIVSPHCSAPLSGKGSYNDWRE